MAEIDERLWVVMFGEYVYHPFATAPYMLFGQAPVMIERALDNGVDAALQQLVRRDDGRVTEHEQHAAPGSVWRDGARSGAVARAATTMQPP